MPHLKVPALGSPRRTALSLFTSAALAVGALSPPPLFLPFASTGAPWSPTAMPRADAITNAPNFLIRASSGRYVGSPRNLAQRKQNQGVALFRAGDGLPASAVPGTAPPAGAFAGGAPGGFAGGAPAAGASAP